jgi:hypothetical protein
MQDNDERFFPATPLIGSEFKRRRYALDVPGDWSVDEALSPNALRHHAKKLSRGDIIEYIWADGSREVWASVTAIGPGYVALRVILHVDQASDAEAAGKPLEESDFDLSFSPNAQHAWRVINRSTGDIVSKGHGTKGDAQAYLTRMLSADKVA